MTEALTLAVRWALYLDLMLLFGLPAFALYGLRAPTNAKPFPSRSFIGAITALALLLSLAGLVITAAIMAGVNPIDIDAEQLGAFLSDTTAGAAWKVRMAMLGIILAILCSERIARRIRFSAIAICAGTALSTLAWAGHAASHDGLVGLVHLGADSLHLLAAGIWIGALGGLLHLLFRRDDSDDHIRRTHQALNRFGRVGSITVRTILMTGLVNGQLLVGTASLKVLLSGSYGQLLLMKLLLFGAMLILAALNRFRLTPALEAALSRGRGRQTITRLRLSVAIETASAVAILALVAWLGMLDPTNPTTL